MFFLHGCKSFFDVHLVSGTPAAYIYLPIETLVTLYVIVEATWKDLIFHLAGKHANLAGGNRFM